MTSFQRITRPRLSEMVAGEIEEAIIAGSIAIGASLPSEQRLAEEFGVSRNVVREALKYLKERGLIEILNGSGAYVTRPSMEATSNALGRYLRLVGASSSAGALYEVRRILEGANARLAAERADDEDRAVLSACLERMREHRGSIQQWSEADLDFHLAIAKATHNPFLSVLLEPLVEQLRDVIMEGYLVPGAVDGGLEAHVELLDAIQRRDPEGAYRVLMSHLHDSEARVREVVQGEAAEPREK